MLMKLKSSQEFTEFEGKLVIGFTALLLCPWDFNWHKHMQKFILCILLLLMTLQEQDLPEELIKQ